MTHLPSFSRAMLLALPLTLGSALVAAAPAAPAGTSTDLKRVEVSGHGTAEQPRRDMRKACPSADRQLQAALAPAIYREGKAGLVRVEFKLTGEHVSEVRSSGQSARDYRRAISMAMYKIDCAQHSGEEQLYSFLIKFTPPGKESTDYTVALLDQ